VEQPGLALERRCGVGIQRLVPVEQDVALLVEEPERRERDARERTPVGERGIGPGLVLF